MTGLQHLDAGPTVFFPLEVTLVSIMFASSSLVLIGLIFSDDFSPLMVQEPLFLTGRPPC